MTVPAERVVAQTSSFKNVHVGIIKSYTWPNLSFPSSFRSSLVFFTHCGFLLFCWKFNFKEFSNFTFLHLFLWIQWFVQSRRYIVAQRKRNQESLWILTVVTQEEHRAKPNANFDHWFQLNQVFPISIWNWFHQEPALFC